MNELVTSLNKEIKQVLITSVIAIGTIMLKMVSMRAILNFLCNVLSLISTYSKVSQEIPISSVPKLNIENIFNTIIQTPLTPLIIITNVRSFDNSCRFLKSCFMGIT